MTSSGVYLIENSNNGKRYIGSSVNMPGRFLDHKKLLRRGRHHSPHLQASWNKYGEGAFRFEVLEEWEPEFCVSMEQWWINMLRPEYNHRSVAQANLGVIPSEETRARISNSKRGKSQTPEHIAKRVAANTGKKRSLESRAAISAALKGRKNGPMPQEQRDKIGAALRKPWSATRRRAGNPSGWHHTPEARQKISAARRKCLGEARP